MSFTNDDLKRFTDYLSLSKPPSELFPTWKWELEALLARLEASEAERDRQQRLVAELVTKNKEIWERLEAAENIVIHVSHVPSEVRDHYLQAWRKKAGKGTENER